MALHAADTTIHTRVKDLLRHKGMRIVSTAPSTSVYDTIAKMVENNVGSILITEEGAVRGIFTERDYLRRIVLQGRTSQSTEVQAVMTAEVVCVDPSYTVQECLAIMTDKKIRHLPVIEEGQVAGVISIGDCVKELSQDALVRIQYLTDYITGQYPA